MPVALLDDNPTECLFCGSNSIDYGVRDGYMVVVYKPACSRCAADMTLLGKVKEIVDAIAVWGKDDA